MKTIIICISLCSCIYTVLAQTQTTKIGTVSAQLQTENPKAIFIVGQPFVASVRTDTLIAAEIGFLPLSTQYFLSVTEDPTTNYFLAAAAPNPTTGTVRVTCDAGEKSLQWLLQDAQGRTAKHGEVASGKQEFILDMSGLSNGTYSLVLMQQEKRTVMKVVLVR